MPLTPAEQRELVRLSNAVKDAGNALLGYVQQVIADSTAPADPTAGQPHRMRAWNGDLVTCNCPYGQSAHEQVTG